jgi:hypothetical protein
MRGGRPDGDDATRSEASAFLPKYVLCVDDELKEDFPVRPYFSTIFESRCLDYDGQWGGWPGVPGSVAKIAGSIHDGSWEC